MEIVVGDGCTGYGIKDIDCNVNDFLHKFIDELSSEHMRDLLMDIVVKFGVETYCDSEPCETCGDYYSEYTLKVWGS